jgi:capsular polysaccharide export protein
MGIMALSYNCPVICLGQSVYQIKDLTFQGNLDDFWTQCELPDTILFHSFKKVLIHYTQVNGNFYTQIGIEMAVAYSVKRILSSHCILDNNGQELVKKGNDYFSIFNSR